MNQPEVGGMTNTLLPLLTVASKHGTMLVVDPRPSRSSLWLFDATDGRVDSTDFLREPSSPTPRHIRHHFSACRK